MPELRLLRLLGREIEPADRVQNHPSHIFHPVLDVAEPRAYDGQPIEYTVLIMNDSPDTVYPARRAYMLVENTATYTVLRWVQQP